MDRADLFCRHPARSKVGDGGIGIDLDSVEALAEKAVGVKLSSACGLETLTRPSGMVFITVKKK